MTTGVPKGLRRAARRLVDSAGWLRLTRRPQTALSEQSRDAWRKADPGPGLTWGMELTGDAFITKAVGYGLRGTVLEVGPGYGRLLESAIRLNAPFDKWIGLDLSPQNVEHLSARWPEQRFILGDAELVDPGEPVDAIVSSLTLKHVFPSFEALLANLVASLTDDGLVVIDLIEGRHLRHFEAAQGNFIRSYSQSQVRDLFGRCGLTASFDTVTHAPGWERMLAVGRRR
jgi:SAM-dependent methyltransferase